MFKEEHSEFWNVNDPECNDDLFHETMDGLGECCFDLGQRSILHALTTMSVEEMLTHEDETIRELGQRLEDGTITFPYLS